MADREKLRDEVIRLHVVGASDSEADQSVKLQIRDTVIASLEQALSDATSIADAKAYIQDHLPQIENAANALLEKLGSDEHATVLFTEEVFQLSQCETFALPSGVYESLRVTIGEGKGKNWWGVMFPSICSWTSTSGAEDVTAGAFFSDGLGNAAVSREGYEIRFFFLDLLGKIENFFFRE